MSKKLFLAALVVVLLDQVSKFLAPDYVEVSHNYGAAFGLFQGYTKLFIFVALFVLFLIWKYRKEYDELALGLLAGGAIGNLIDRVFRGYVVDFIDVGFWPSFNLADSFSVIAVLLLIYYSWKR